MRNKLFTLILSLLLCLTLLPVPAMGEDAQNHTANIQQILADQGKLWLTFTTSVQDLNGGNMSLLMNGEPLNTLGVNRIKDSTLKTSYVFLVDASYKLTTNGLNQARSIIVHLLNMLPANSNIGVITVEEAVAPQAPVTLTDDRAAVLETVKGLKLRNNPEAGKKDNPELSLYRAVTNMEYLIDSAANVNARRVLVVLSDGLEDAVDGLTVSELEEKLQGVDLLIHTIALMAQNGHDMSAVQEMSSWARRTGGQALSVQGRNNGQSGTALDRLYTSPENYTNNPLYKLAEELSAAENELYAAGFTVQASRVNELSGECAVQMRIIQGTTTLTYPSPARPLEKEIRDDLRQYAGNPVVMITAAPTAVPTQVPATEAPTQDPGAVTTPVQNTTETTAAPVSEGDADPAGDAAAPETPVEGSDDGGMPAVEGNENAMVAESVDAALATTVPVTLTGNETVDGILTSLKGVLEQVAAFMVQPLLGVPMWVFFAAGAVLLIVLVVIIVVVRRKRKNRMAEDLPISISPNPEDLPNFEMPIFDQPDMSDKTFDPSMVAMNPSDNERTVPTGAMDIPMTMPGSMPAPAPAVRAIRLIMTEMQVPAPKQYLHVTADAVTVIGRKAGMAAWVLPGNESLSGRHCQIERVGERLILSDLHSTNGTFVNGKRIEGPVQIDQDVKITLGKITYNFNWMYV